MAGKGLRWLVPGLMQIPVCLALIGAGFAFDDLESTVMFLYAYHYIMMAFKDFFRFFFHQDEDEVVCLPIRILNPVTQVVLQCWGLSAVSDFLWRNNSCEETPTVVSAIIIVIIELVWVVIMVVKICELLGARMPKCLWGKRPTNSRTPVDNNEPNEDMDGLLTTTNHNNSDTENDINS